MNEGAFAKLILFWQLNKKLTMFFGELLGGPTGRKTGSFAKIIKIDFSNGSPVMISRDNDISAFTELNNAFIGIGSITNQIT